MEDNKMKLKKFYRITLFLNNSTSAHVGMFNYQSYPTEKEILDYINFLPTKRKNWIVVKVEEFYEVTKK